MNKIRKCEICLVETTKLGSHLKSKHKLTSEEYYLKYINNNYVNKCLLKDCDNSTKFYGVNTGYTSYCSISCRMKDRHKDESYSLNNIEMTKNKSRSNEGMKSLHKQYVDRAKKKNIEEGIFYIMKFNTFIKIGVCYYVSEKLIHFKKRKSLMKPIKYEVFKGSIDEVSYYEYIIKSSYMPILSTEYFSLKDYNEIKSKLPNTILPYSTQVNIGT